MNRTVIIAGIAVILLGTAVSTDAKPMEAGVILGEPTGLVVKLWQNKTNAIDVAAAWSLGGEAIHIHADYLIHKYDLLKMGGNKLPVYFGLGVKAVLLSDRIVMMTNGPAATIGEILEVDLPRPRNRVELSDDAKYNHYRHEVLQFLYERQRRPGEETKVKATDDESPELKVVKTEAA